MAVTAKVLSATLSGSTGGSVDVTSSGFGAPDCVLIWANAVTTPGTSATPGAMSFGVTDGTDQWALAFSDKDAMATSEAYSYKSTSEVVLVKNGAANLTTASAAVIKDGVRLTNTAGGTSYHVTVLLLRGVKRVYAGSLTMTGTTPVVVTSPGFKPSVLFTGWNSLATASSSGTDAFLSLGVAHNSSADVVTQATTCIYARDSAATMITATSVRGDSVSVDANAPTTRYFTVSSFSATGFSIVSSASATTDVHYLAIQLADPDAFDVTIRDSATVSGDIAYAGTGFTPLAVGIYGTVETATNTASAEGASLSVGLMDGTTIKSLQITSDNGVGTSNTGSQGSTSAFVLRFADGTPDASATLVSLDSDGFTLNHSSASNASAAARKMVTWAFGAGSVGTVRHYWVVFPANESTPSSAQIVAGQKASGTAAPAFGSEMDPASTGTVYGVPGATGLTAGDYKLAVVAYHDSTLAYSNVVTSATFTVPTGTLTAAQGSYALTGQDAALRRSHVIVAAQGSYALTGQDATLTYAPATNVTLTAEFGTYTLTGFDAALTRSHLIVADAGSYTFTGQDAALGAANLMTAESGSYALTGYDVVMTATRLLTAAQGSYALTGQDATLTHGAAGATSMAADQGSYVLTGQDASLLVTYRMAADQGSYALAGQDATLLAQRLMAAESGTYVLTGQDLTFRLSHVLSAGYGSYTLTGCAATLTYTSLAASTGSASATITVLADDSILVVPQDLRTIYVPMDDLVSYQLSQ